MKTDTTPFAALRCSTSLVLAGCAVLLSGCGKQSGGGAASSKGSEAAAPGLTLVQELTSNTTDLIDNDGRLVHRWTSKYRLGGGAYIQPNGNLVRTGILQNNPFNTAACPGLAGTAEILDWDGNQLWSYEFGTKDRSLHHDIAVMPNGNVLMLGVEQKYEAEQLEAGRDPSRMRHEIMWVDYIIEMKPTGKSGGEIVWEWHTWDHLIQDFDKTKKNYGVVADNPGRIDINFVEENILSRGDSTLARLQSLGYVSSGSAGPVNPRGGLPDWTHTNSIAYNPDLDQIVISVRGSGEFWIIDHATSMAEARGDKGGKRGKGGQLLYRWGNPQSYQRGAPQDQMLFGQHDVHWIAKGLPGAGNIFLFNNGDNRKDGAYSTIEEIKPPLKPDGSYEIEEGAAYGPTKPVWRYIANPKESFYSQFLSGVDRLPNGNTLICSGMEGRLFEVTPAGKTVWSKNGDELPPSGARRIPGAGGGPPGFGGPGSGQEMPERKPMGDHGLTAAEIAFLMAGTTFGPPMPGNGPEAAGGPGMGAPSGQGPGGAAGGPPGMQRPPGMGRGPGAGGGRAGPRGAGGPPTKGLFRATKYPLDYPAFKDRKLEPISLPAPAPAAGKQAK